jgi:hypothetical protein
VKHQEPIDHTATGHWWVPRSWRRYITPATVVGAVVIIFQAGIWWNQEVTKQDMRDTKQAVSGDPEKKRMQQEIDDMKADFNRRLTSLEEWRNGAQTYKLPPDLKRKGVKE